MTHSCSNQITWHIPVVIRLHDTFLLVIRLHDTFLLHDIFLLVIRLHDIFLLVIRLHDIFLLVILLLLIRVPQIHVSIQISWHILVSNQVICSWQIPVNYQYRANGVWEKRGQRTGGAVGAGIRGRWKEQGSSIIGSSAEMHILYYSQFMYNASTCISAELPIILLKGTVRRE